MLNVREDKITNINSLIKMKLRKGFFDLDFLHKVFADFGEIIKMHGLRFFELSEAYFRDKVPEINIFAFTCFKLYFEIPDSDKKIILSKIIGFICEKTGNENLPFAVHSDYKTNALIMLREINKDEQQTLELINNLPQLMVSFFHISQGFFYIQIHFRKFWNTLMR